MRLEDVVHEKVLLISSVVEEEQGESLLWARKISKTCLNHL